MLLPFADEQERNKRTIEAYDEIAARYAAHSKTAAKPATPRSQSAERRTVDLSSTMLECLDTLENELKDVLPTMDRRRKVLEALGGLRAVHAAMFKDKDEGQRGAMNEDDCIDIEDDEEVEQSPKQQPPQSTPDQKESIPKSSKSSVSAPIYQKLDIKPIEKPDRASYFKPPTPKADLVTKWWLSEESVESSKSDKWRAFIPSTQKVSTSDPQPPTKPPADNSSDKAKTSIKDQAIGDPLGLSRSQS
jgi:hypothetical protein